MTFEVFDLGEPPFAKRAFVTSLLTVRHSAARNGYWPKAERKLSEECIEWIKNLII
jgi:hypothetical protein